MWRVIIVDMENLCVFKTHMFKNESHAIDFQRNYNFVPCGMLIALAPIFYE
jgi:hypothetical protein